MQQVFRREGINLYYYSNKTKKFSLDSWYLPQLHLLESKGNKKSKAATDQYFIHPSRTRQERDLTDRKHRPEQQQLQRRVTRWKKEVTTRSRPKETSSTHLPYHGSY
ncbi:putative mitochondrial protein (mitochondrion) [Arabidopsis thaliana]|jgi:hypothetical protein|uniref:Uncharacterized mitochondrial protein AtMg01030 n=6 Tax=Brassicaceae TaxID=3700 RepID=M1030_ARATH|nr:uncharacterized protein LOC9313289 [Arabidopsis lyrata subsp. lyrata]P92537.1 RecName: Full=Uncharacterized mitochondrial protein AtMg01030; AltName: Full=ORF106e [Arabidopsis thaliana]KAG7527955.1 hypothetical protein ISN44_Un239g000030 [Arabidopsis suecica]KAG7528942.1 hypothetical protein ISN45_Un107g000160 [Arabidopsis thaliana x Arabidopsis arenosa]BBB05386.1 ORF106C protein [Turritis glabra]EFH53480.1 hypothetical protein ARALYDRAFT_905317 [Arabidopsis lyrata subsp. lyrata]KAG7529214|eukprot:XP_020880459.1 uncharacterized protein LOC9313289 [Arabidopsis lyrata subsp. lyrata]